MPSLLKLDPSSIMNIPIWDTPGQYLGIPAEWGNSKSQASQWINERVFSKLGGWKEQYLSQAGKEVLIKSIIQAIPTYVMSIVRLSKNFCQSLCSGIAKF